MVDPILQVLLCLPWWWRLGCLVLLLAAAAFALRAFALDRLRSGPHALAGAACVAFALFLLGAEASGPACRQGAQQDRPEARPAGSEPTAEHHTFVNSPVCAAGNCNQSTHYDQHTTIERTSKE